jgi:hypothetical protein
MPGQTLTTEAFILGKSLPAESFQPYTAFSADHGALRILQRISRKASSTAQAPLDLFDEAEVLIETSNQGQTWFSREVRVLTRHAEIGHSYDALRLASAFASVVAGNPVHEESRAAVYALLRTAFTAFASAARPDIVYLKSLYCFARDEGYPVKQQWVAELNTADRTLASAVLNQPLATSSTPAADVARLQVRLENYLRGHTEIILP